MEFAPWNDKLTIGIQFVDQDHRGLFELVNRLHKAMSGGCAKAEIPGIILELKGYAASHFTREEALLQDHQFPGLDRHKKLHREFTSKINELAAKHDGGSSLVSIELLKYLRKWLTDHIAEDDALYRDYLKTTGKLPVS